MISENCRKSPSQLIVGSTREKAEEGALDITAIEENKSFQQTDQDKPYTPTIERIVSDWNIQEAAESVRRNKGAPGIDGMTTKEIDEFLKNIWPRVKEEILSGTYNPDPVRRVEIEKPDGSGMRKLGIPTVSDRIIQQAILQEIVYVFEATFSENSYGFRLGRSAHQAVKQAQTYLKEGYEWVVDIDLEKFFDRVNHDMLMARVARAIKDKKILLLIRSYLKAGVMEDGIISASEEGTPQGGPLSPILSNIILTDFDKELERRGHKFCRYADDCNIYVKSEEAGNRVMQSLVNFLTKKLKLKVNLDKSAVDRPWNRKFLGFSFTKGKNPMRIKIHESRIKRFKDKIKKHCRYFKSKNVSATIKNCLMPYIRGWINYYSLAEARTVIKELDSWVRRRVRAGLWRMWKKPKSRIKNLMKYQISKEDAKKMAHSSKGPWRLSKTEAMHKALSNATLRAMGLIGMVEIIASLYKV
jgi:RNA-directed DNA polymerase